MSDKIEYSRLILKRSDVSGVTPTVTSATTLNNFTETDLFSGEMFLNTVDERAFVRMNNSILEFDLVSSGGTDYNFCSTGIQTSAISGCSPVDIYDDLNLNTNVNITTSNGDGILRLDDGGNPNTIFLGTTGTTDFLSIDPDGNLNGTQLVSQSGNDSGSLNMTPTFSNLNLDINSSSYESSFTQQYTTGKVGNNMEMIITTIDNVGSGGESTIILNSYLPVGGGVSSVSITTDTLLYGNNLEQLYSNNANHQLQFNNQQVDLFNGTPTNTEINIGNSTSTINLSGQTTVHQNMTVNGDLNTDNISFDGGTTKWVFKELEIGDWDMDTTATLFVNHNLSVTEWKTIRNISTTIRNDADTSYYELVNSGSGVEGGISGWISTNIVLQRTGGGLFDSTDFDSTSYNRGFVTFWYKPD